MRDWKKTTVGIVGMGKSGLAAARFLAAKGAKVYAYDKKAFESFDAAAKEAWKAVPGVELRTGHEKANALDGVDLIVLSPGVPQSVPPVARQIEKRVPVWGEMELASQFVTAPIIAIGGTNGKSTTTELVGGIMQRAGWNTFVGGNLGTPLIEGVEGGYELFVLEVSSFQMETVEMFHPHVAVLLNVTADHLDRYPGMQAYAEAKANMFRRMLPDDIAVVNGDDKLVMSVAPSRPQVWKWSFEAPVAQGAWSDGEGLHFVTPPAVIHLRRDEIALTGRHNEENVMAAVLACLSMGVTSSAVKDVLKNFKGLPHRVELVRERRGVTFIDDSKGTNLGAVAAALKGFKQPVVLIAGGVDKGGDYHEIDATIRAHVKAVVAIGQSAPLIADAWGEIVPVKKAASMAEAVQKAADLAKRGDAVLLSPACSSFDMFKDYKDRGDQFQAAVRGLED
jgi:UDP-N-acetylmuramoylalanine--D-glutamate ligase